MAAINTIAIDLTPILPGGENGGAKIFVLELISQLATLAPQTRFVLLTQAAAHEELKQLECNNIQCVMVMDKSGKNQSFANWALAIFKKLPLVADKLGTLGLRLFSLLKRWKGGTLLRDKKVELLFCPFTAPTFAEPGIPTVCTIYDLQYKTYPEFFSAADLAYRNYIFEEACQKASMLTAISEYSRQSAICHGKIDPQKIQTIHLQMAQRILPKANQETSIHSRLALCPQQYFLYPANFWKHKNHEMLLTAFGIACEQGLAANIKLVCTGAAVARQPWLEEAAEKMQLGGRVLFPGFLTDQEISELLVNSKGILFPSLYEGFGLPVIEAMAAGIPVACSDLTALPEIAAEAALFFNPRIPTEIAAAIIALDTDVELRNKLINAGKVRATMFANSEKMAQEYWQLFQHVLQGEKAA